MDVPHIAPDILAGWVLARDAFEKLTEHFDDAGHAQVVLARRLGAGIVLAGAETLVHHRGDSQRRTDNVFISPDEWQRTELGSQCILWTTSEIDIDNRTTGRSAELEDEDCNRYFGVRFAFDGLNKIAPIFDVPTHKDADVATEQIAPLPTAPAVQKAPLSISELDRIAKAVAAGWGETLSETGAWRYAQAHWPEYKIAKHRFLAQYRIFRGVKRPGKASINQ